MRAAEIFTSSVTDAPATALIDMRNSGGIAFNRRELNRSSLQSPARMSMTMIALLRWAALMENSGQLRGADRAAAPGSETARNAEPRANH